ncbi:MULTISPECIES: DUF6484 domain-containing protein [unclassified Mesorhizobium]|uniref:DUF6484 domain-containing protein n=1 Tax=unclassified Mesorhizobium TaxID=325217 RepID=UPI000FCA6CD6|nr:MULTISPECIES: DUF6484 domain-containing protein [unclassified Mesorhizobium]TGP20065.1 hypothetical protein EN874_027165 [Mesorhizobium sp. M1D.F.Ca.ET.231.01.1.1]TGP27437.1 hypothetical protein EN877_26450 [Mesorhizobium sp. M1D.F.Ca.ET.234.01.1.1]TGS41472.1 hypothetical protein EN827_25535 [Mesorhizobium sp. M1D.F.Ca.ET.184.01.1.1]TGS59233.1 hypothetical protein EN826_025535 [Mesorhizobium sp. M1D.F.Ca.ET.183.01.1.1]
MAKLRNRIEGVVIGQFLGFDDEQPLVVFPGNPQETALPARSLAELSSGMIGQEVALLFEGGDPQKPLIVGRIVEPAKKLSGAQVFRDGERVRIHAEERLELRCGKATILMEADGRITIRGTFVTSHASATNRMRGGSINLN